MIEAGHNSGAGHLRAFVERIERLEEEIKTINDDKSEVYKEAKATGFNVKVLRKVISARRQEVSERQEIDALFDMYMHALGEAPESLVRAHVENIEEIPSPASRFPQVDGGRPAQSSDEVPSEEQGSIANGQSGQQPEAEPQDRNEPVSGETSSADDFQPPAFLVKERAPLRPHCLNPDLCAGSGREHCHACRKALAESEAA